MSEKPKEFDRIWLQTCGDSMSEWYGEITWCQDNVNDDDVEYVNATLYAALKQQRDELLKDVDRLDFLEAQSTPGMGWIARHSFTGRGYRLHQDPSFPIATAREAIDAAIANVKDKT